MGEAAPGEVTRVAAATSSQDPEVGLAAVAALRGLVKVLEALQVGYLVGPDGSRRVQKDPLDDHRDDQGPPTQNRMAEQATGLAR